MGSNVKDSFGRERWWSRFSPATKKDLQRLKDNIMAKVSELAGRLTAAADKVEKIEKEVIQLKTDFDLLKAGLGDTELPADATAALERIEATHERIDALNEDTAPAPPA